MTPSLQLTTKRLELRPATVEHIIAELRSNEELAIQLRVDVPRGWPPGQYDRSAQEYFRDRLHEDGKNNPGWYSWYAVTRAEPATVIAAGGYIGPPNEEGEVEIGFSVVPEWRRQGYAAELTTALIEHAFADRRVVKIIAHAAAANNESRSVLLRCGFNETDGVNDDGDTRFEIPDHAGGET